MKLLLDTHVVLWWLDDPDRLSDRARKAINVRETFVSAVTGCEIGQKSAVGKLRVPDDLDEQIEENEFLPLPISLRHGLATAALPLHHKDPFDRLLVAQARCEGLTLVTADRRITDYDVPILPATE
jgi:PIN domain nuclease of toxin-antitoxin system